MWWSVGNAEFNIMLGRNTGNDYLIGKFLTIYKEDILRFFVENYVSQITLAAIFEYLNLFDQIFKDFIIVNWFNFRNNGLDFCFQFKNGLWFVSIDFVLNETKKKYT